MNNININKNTSQSGRSMIEMLGVLAIVGVLSVGGIAGYSKAMDKFKTNKLISQISQIAGNVRTLFAQQSSYGENIHWDENVRKMLLPDDVNKTAMGASDFTNDFGGRSGFNVTGLQESYDNKSFSIYHGNLPKNVCMEIAAVDWGSNDGFVGIAVGRGYFSWPAEIDSVMLENCDSGYYNFSGSSSLEGIYSCKSPISPATLANAMKNWPDDSTNLNDDQHGCVVLIKFK